MTIFHSSTRILGKVVGGLPSSIKVLHTRKQVPFLIGISCSAIGLLVTLTEASNHPERA